MSVPWVLCLLLGAAPAPLGAAATAGAVATDHPLASAAGVEVLAAGGNAVDAAVAAALAASVVQPAGSGMGGGGFAVVRTVDGISALDFREVAPAAATPDTFLEAGEPVAWRSRVGGLAVAVPGQSRGLARLLATHGRLEPDEVAAPAVRLARDGFGVGSHLSRVLARTRLGAVRALFLREGALPTEGERLRRPAHAALIAAWADSGGEDLHTGEGAAAVVDAVRAAGGVMSAADLAGYAPRPREPVTGSYRGWTVTSMPLPSAGGPLLLQMLGVLETHDLAALGWGSDALLHLLAETLQHAFADRAARLGDVDLDVGLVTGPARVAAIAAAFDPARTLPVDAYGPAVAPPAGGGTQHISAVDAEGMAVALTVTINGGFGSGVVVEELGLILNNEMDDFSLAPGVPDQFGLVGSQANAVGVGKRPLSAMTPTVLEAPDGRVVVLGGSGGARILSATLQVLVGIVDFGLAPQAAVEAPRIHHQWRPRRLDVEAGIPAAVREALAQRGHAVRVGGGAAAVQVAVLAGGRATGAADPRKGGAAAESPVPVRADMHLDTLTQMRRRGLSLVGEGLQGSLPRLEDAGQNLVFEVLWSPPQADAAATATALGALLDSELDALGHRVALAGDPQAADRIVASGRVAVLLSMEGADGFAADGDPALHAWYRRGLRAVGLTWNHGNRYAASCCDGAEGGLTADGRALVAHLQDLGMLVDVAHTSWQTARDVCALARAPIIASHANAHTVHAHPRNLPPDVLACIAETGGVIGLTLHGPFVAPANSVEAVVAHAREIIAAVGVDHLALGSDFDGARHLPPGLGHAGQLGRLWEALAASGLTEAELAKVRGGNVRRVWGAAWAARDPAAVQAALRAPPDP